MPARGLSPSICVWGGAGGGLDGGRAWRGRSEGRAKREPIRLILVRDDGYSPGHNSGNNADDSSGGEAACFSSRTGAPGCGAYAARMGECAGSSGCRKGRR